MFKVKSAENTGADRQAKRLRDKAKLIAKIPHAERPDSRQVRRRIEMGRDALRNMSVTTRVPYVNAAKRAARG